MTDLSTIYTLNRTSQKKAKKKRGKNSEKFENSSVDVDIDFVTTSDNIKKDHKIKECKEVESSDLDRIALEYSLNSDTVTSKEHKKNLNNYDEESKCIKSECYIPQAGDCKRKKKKYEKIENSYEDMEVNVEWLTNTENTSKTHKKKKKIREVKNNYFDKTLHKDSLKSSLVASKEQTQHFKINHEVSPCIKSDLDCTPSPQKIDHERKKKKSKQLEKSCSDFEVQSLVDTESIGTIRKKKKSKEVKHLDFDRTLQENSSISDIISKEFEPKLNINSDEVSLCMKSEFGSVHETKNHKRKKRNREKSENLEIDIKGLENISRIPRKKSKEEYVQQKTEDDNLELEVVSSQVPKKKRKSISDDSLFTSSGLDCATIPQNVDSKRKKKYSKLKSSGIENDDENITTMENVSRIHKKKKSKEVENFDRTSLDNGSRSNVVYSKEHKQKRKTNCEELIQECPEKEEKDSVYLEPKSEIIISNPEHLVSDSVKNLQLFSDLTSKKDTNLQKNLNLGVLNCEDEPVSFEIPLLHLKESVKNLTKEEKEYFESKGIKIKQGRFTNSEDNILKRNLLEFCSQYKVSDPFQLLGIGNDYNSKFWKFLKAKHFNVRLGKDLNDRTLHSIYKRARTLFSISQDGKMLKNNSEEIIKYQKMYGNTWTHIGKLVDESSSRVRNTFLWSQKPVNKGYWTSEEENLLEKAIETFVILPSSSDMKKIPWEKVAELVPTRNAAQCRLHWGEYMAWEPDAERKVWNKDNDKTLIDELKSRGVNEGKEIDWKDLHKLFKDYAPSYMFLQKRWRKLKEKLS